MTPGLESVADGDGSLTDTARGQDQKSAPTIVALVGATGGSGTTRTAVELATSVARNSLSVLVIDAAFATQGLSEFVTGRITPDVTTLITAEPSTPVQSSTVQPSSIAEAIQSDENRTESSNSPGTIEFLPSYAPFERIARAKTPAAAERFEELAEEASEWYDIILLDVPPVAANQAIAAVTVADTVVGITPGSEHGRDALVRLRERLADLDTALDASICVDLHDTGPISTTDHSIPQTEYALSAAPTCLTDDRYGEALVDVAAACLGYSFDIEFDSSGVTDRARRALSDLNS